MRIDKAAILARDDATTIECFFNGGRQKYIFLVLKKEAKHLDRGDHVVVQTHNGNKIVQVYRVHEETRIDTEATFKYCWAFQKVYVHRVEELNEQQEKIENILRERQRSNVRSQVLQQFGAEESEIRMITGG